MRHVIVDPKVSYAILGVGVAVSLLLAWRAYDTIQFLSEAETAAASYHQVIR